MGFLDKLFGGVKYPELDQTSSAAKKLDGVRGSLEELTEKVKDPMEVVPTENSAYVFIGNPPKNFGMAWIEGGKVKNFKTLSEEKGVEQKQLVNIVDALAEVYQQNEGVDRFSTTIGGRTITVTPSQDLASEVQQIILNA